MFDENENKSRGKLNYKKLNEVVKTSGQVLKIIKILSIFVCSYIGIIVCKELKIFRIILDILGIVSPLFIGLIVAWLFNPIVNFLQKKGVKRIFSVLGIYLVLIGAIALLVGSIMPILYEQIISFAESVPSLFKDIENIFNDILSKFENIQGIDIESVKSSIISQLEGASSEITSGVSTYVIKIVKGLISGVSSFTVGLIIGFFFLLSFENIGETLLALVPRKFRRDTSKLVGSINGSLRNYVVGVIIDATVVFGICSLAFGLVGLRAPMLFALFCAITNVIPFVGPYIGAVPALIVGFSMSPTIGILTLLAIVIIQFFEGNFLQEYIMSKTTKLHPVTIMTGLLIFGHFWGIIGMVISTPVLAVFKQVYLFLDEKYDFFKNNELDDDDDADEKGKKRRKKETETNQVVEAK